MDEGEVLAAIREIAGAPQSSRVTLGIGDDAALWQPSRSNRSAISTDMLVEGVDFSSAVMRLGDAGWRAMAANLSDLAAMGARPVLSTVALGIPKEAPLHDVRELYEGIAAAARAERIAIAGGDLSRAPSYTIAITVVGEVAASHVKLRSRARPGDVIAVTGWLGASRAGLEAAKNDALLSGEMRAEALRAFRRPRARCGEGRFLAASQNVTAMMDCSDGLSSDLHRLCSASGAGASLHRVPVAPSAQAAAAALHLDPERFALDGGEDFELIVTVRPRAFAHLASRFARRFGRELVAVGAVRAGESVDLRGEPVPPAGWDHFAPEVTPSV